jgi:hypothetical protein
VSQGVTRNSAHGSTCWRDTSHTNRESGGGLFSRRFKKSDRFVDALLSIGVKNIRVYADFVAHSVQDPENVLALLCYAVHSGVSG